MTVMDKLKLARNLMKRYSNVVFFVGGFFFDAFTLIRIDSIIDLVLQSFYLLGITLIIMLQAYLEAGRWQPKEWMARLWSFESEIIHFFYGGLLRAYVVLYFKSTSLSRSIIFLVFVFILMLAHEMPQIRRLRSLLRLGLYAFCLISYLNYLFPILIGRMGDWVFSLAWVLSVGLMYKLVRKLANLHLEPKKARVRLGWSPVLVLILVAVFYFFTRIFGPRRFEHQVFLRWELKDPRRNRWIRSDRIPLPVKGGREQGYRGYAYKENYQPGEWRVEVETEDGHVLGGGVFGIEKDLSVVE